MGSRETDPQKRRSAVSRILALMSLLLALTLPVAAQESKIAWYGTWADGLAAAKASGRPILLVAAAPHCKQIPGIW